MPIFTAVRSDVRRWEPLDPVHAQQRGRVFLPFLDDDPRTAEVISKVVLLSRDEMIQDPTILDQLRR